MKSVNRGALHVNDDEFLSAFENCELPNNAFDHGAHVRAAWLYISRYGESDAPTRLSRSIRRFAAHHGSAEKYHHTMTLAWIRLVAAAVRATPDVVRFDDFAARHPELFHQRALEGFYSRVVLDSAAARSLWVEPDLRPLP